MASRRAGGHPVLGNPEEVHEMGEEKTEGVLEKNAHKVALGGQIVAVLSILFLVPVIRRLREQRAQKQNHRFHIPLVGH